MASEAVMASEAEPRATIMASCHGERSRATHKKKISSGKPEEILFWLLFF